MTTEAPEAPLSTLAPEAPLVNRPPAGTMFASRRTDLRLVKVPKYPRFGPGGRQVGEEKGQTIAFRGGQLFVPFDGTVPAEDGQPLDVSEVSEWLRSHRLFGDPHGGFWEVQTAAPPVTQDEIQAALRMATRLDVDGLSEMLRQEREGWDRGDMTGPLEDSIAEIRAALDRAAEQAREEAAKAPKPAAKRAPQS